MAIRSQFVRISIHAPRTGSDQIIAEYYVTRARISIHAPRTGSDLSRCRHRRTAGAFQSTLPARGATPTDREAQRLTRYFNPRSPHGERRVELQVLKGACPFQSTLPARGATHRDTPFVFWRCISIHAPRTGSDAQRGQPSGQFDFISIHAPRTGSDWKGAIRRG